MVYARASENEQISVDNYNAALREQVKVVVALTTKHMAGPEWGTCTSSCGCAKNRKTGYERLPGWHRVSWVACGPSDTVIFEREAVRALQKKRSCF